MLKAFDLNQFFEFANNWREQTLFFSSIGSTNEEARRLLRQAPRELLLLTDQQTAGRGRLGRSWQAPMASGLLFTQTFKLELPLDQAFLYTAALALSVVQAAKNVATSQLALKWPNDLLRDGKKIGGILAELEMNPAGTSNQTWMALGCGLNISLSAEDFIAAGIADKATNLTAPNQSPPPREELLAAIVKLFQAYRQQLLTEAETVRQEWVANLVTLGREVQIRQANSGTPLLTGLAQGVAKDGALLVLLPDNRLERVQAGDVSVRLNDGSYA